VPNRFGVGVSIGADRKHRQTGYAPNNINAFDLIEDRVPIGC